MHNISEILSVELGSKISDICKPILNKMGFNYFCFSRIYKDDSRVLLTNNVKLTKWFLENDFAFGIDTNDSFRSRKILWEYTRNLSNNESKNCFQLLKKSSKLFGVGFGFTLINKKRSSDLLYEMFDFGASESNMAIMDLCLNRQDLINRFIYFFKHNAKELIRSSQKDKIYRPFQKNCYSFDYKNIEKELVLNTSRYYFDTDKRQYLTKKEFENFLCLLKGRTIKEVSQELNN